MLRREAASYFSRLQSRRDSQIGLKFRRWYDADPAHAAAFDRISRSYGAAAVLRHSGFSDRLPAQRPRAPLAAGFAFASVVAAAILGGLLLSGSPPLATGTEAVMLVTKIGEIRQVRLSDGSRLTLDTATSVEVNVGRSERRARLKSGRARFDLTAGANPFVIVAGAARVIANQQAVVDVERDGDQSRVAVVRGTVGVTATSRNNAADLNLRTNKAAIATADRPFAEFTVQPRGDWTRGMLQFAGTPISDAVSAANRYSNRRILLGTGIGELRVTGAFHAGDTEALAKALATAFNLSLARTTGGDLLLASKPPSHPEKK